MTQPKNIRDAVRVIEGAGLHVLEVRRGNAKFHVLTDRGPINVRASGKHFNVEHVRNSVAKLARAL